MVAKYFTLIFLIRGDNVISEDVSKGFSLASSCSKKGRWNHAKDFLDGGDIPEEITNFLNKIEIHSHFLDSLIVNGAKAMMYVQVPGKINSGFVLPPSVLDKLSNLRISFGLEIFPDWNEDP